MIRAISPSRLILLRRPISPSPPESWNRQGASKVWFRDASQLRPPLQRFPLRFGTTCIVKGIDGKEKSASNNRSRPYAAFAQLFLGMATFGSATPVSKIVAGAVPVFIGSLLRVGLGALVLAPFAWRRRDQLREMRRKQWLLLALIAVLGMFGFSVLMLVGMKMVSGVVGAIIMSTTPAVTAAASMLFMRDQPTWRKLAAIGLAVCGITVIQLGGDSDQMLSADNGNLVVGSAMVFCAVCCEAAYTLLGKKLTETISPVLASFLAAAASLPLFIPFAAWQWSIVSWAHIEPGQWAALAWYGAGTLAFGTWLWYSGVSKTEGSIAAGFMGVMPVSALVLSYVLLGDAFHWLHALGFSIVFSGVLLISVEHARAASTDSSA